MFRYRRLIFQPAKPEAVQGIVATANSGRTDFDFGQGCLSLGCSETAGLDWSSSLPTNIGNKGFETVGTTPAGTSGTQGAYVHWTATAQLGVV